MSRHLLVGKAGLGQLPPSKYSAKEGKMTQWILRKCKTPFNKCSSLLGLEIPVCAAPAIKWIVKEKKQENFFVLALICNH